MKKATKDIFLFLITFLFIYSIIFALFFFVNVSGTPLIYRTTMGNVWKGGGTYVKFKKFDAEKKWDVIIMGSSHAYRGYDPEIFKKYGYETYNLGTSDQNMMCTYYIAKNYVNKNNCKTVILDMYDRVFTNQNIESMSDVIQNVNSETTALEVAMHCNDIRGINMLAFRYFNKLEAPLNTDTTGYINGYVSTDKKLKLPGKPKGIKYKTNKYQMRYFNLLLEYLTGQGIKVVLTTHPLPTPYILKDHELCRKDILPIANKYGIKYFDYMSDSSLTSINNFFDETHLNMTGVEKYNNRLIPDLQHAGVLPLKSEAAIINSSPIISVNTNKQ